MNANGHIPVAQLSWRQQQKQQLNWVEWENIRQIVLRLNNEELDCKGKGLGEKKGTDNHNIVIFEEKKGDNVFHHIHM